MYRYFCKTVILIISFFCYAAMLYSQQKAFPTAEGYGKYTVGGRGGVVYEVTNLNDSGEGSLRAAIEASGPRTVVFRVSGTIILESDLEISSPYITIAGQTAPGDGICIRRYPLEIKTDEVIVRYIRVRLGDESGEASDAIWGRYCENIIIDHVSASWSVDESMSLYYHSNITVQWCLISESLYNSNHPKGRHGYGGIWGSNYSSYHHNLLAHHSSRNPRFSPGCENTDFRNNVVYNWGYNSSYGGEKVQPEDSLRVFSNINIVANYYKPGPATKPGEVTHRIVNPTTSDGADDHGKFYVANNYMGGNATVTSDNWNGGIQPEGGSSFIAGLKLDQPWPSMAITEQAAEEAYQMVLENAGAILPGRDTVDARIIDETRIGYATYEGPTYEQENTVPDPLKMCGIIDSQNDVGGWPVLNTGPGPEDKDHDGMPDSWETTQGLNPDDPEDRNDIGEGGYTNLEIYLNSITEFPSFLVAPTNVTVELVDFTKFEVNWEDNCEDETGFRIERAEGDTGSFTTVAEVQANVTTYIDSLLNELTLYQYRVMAFNDSLESGFEGIAKATTLSPTSPPLAVSDPIPESNAVYVATGPALGWKASINADSYDIYFGTENPPPYVSNQVEITFAPGELDRGKTYYWRIDGKNANGTTEGTLWNFTVKPEIIPQQIAYWKFDETDGTTASSEGDSSLNGVLTNMGASSWTDGILNGALSFDGSDEYVLVPHGEVLDFRDESFSISAWLKSETLAGNSMFLIHKGSFSADETAGTNGKWYGIEIKNNELRFAIDDNVNKSQATLSNVNGLLEGKWVHIAAVRDTEDGNLKLYVNGEMLASISDGTGSISQDIDLYLGNSSTGSGTIAGILDELKLFNYALSGEEVLAIYESLAGGVGIKETLPNEVLPVRIYPNPFSSSATIQYQLKSESEVALCIYNIVGREIKTLINQQQSAGAYSVVFDASNMESGIYIFRLRIDSFEQRGKMLLLK